MLKKISPLIIFLFLVSCGYQAMHSLENRINYNFSINEIKFTGNRDINIKIKNDLNSFYLVKQERNFNLDIESENKKLVLVKDSKGNSVSFKNILTIKVKILNQNKKIDTISFEETFEYNNNTNKIELRRYEKEIKNNLTETMVNNLIFELSKIR
tara:strand:- start:77 stop:541 length:465 start_codon:yes stop_codon:yes gene_type:complete